MAKSQIQLRARVTCPHCWHIFAPEEVYWVASHPDLRGDPLLGEDEAQRFLPTRFDPSGNALDVNGVACPRLACPRCHLGVSRAFLEMEPMFLSILGAPGSGKSYFLAAMTWQLRNTLREHFRLSFGDADPVGNQIVSQYEETLFYASDDQQLVALPKTQQEGDLYESVNIGERQIWYPRPFVFSIEPQENHPRFSERATLSRALCMYDNAGEHFLPGGETTVSPATRHLALSRVLLFLFDPTQHPRFRKKCQGVTSDPQMGEHGWTHRQDQVLSEAASRIRVHRGMAQHERYKRPLVVVVTKYDAWQSLLNNRDLRIQHVVRKTRDGLSALDIDAIRAISNEVRQMLSKYAPEVVSAAEGFSQDVTYLPVSALGCPPTLDKGTGALGIRPADIKPLFAELPILYALHRSARGLIYSGMRKKSLPTARALDPSGDGRCASAKPIEQDLSSLKEPGS